jgi:glucose/arabinose dehydrogenase
MPTRTQLTGAEGADAILGGPGADLVYGYDPAAAPVEGIAATRVASGLDQPLALAASPGDPTWLLVAEKGGAIRVLDPATGVVRDEPFLDLSGEVSTEGEQGLLGLALAPDFGETGRFYVNLTDRRGDTEIREYRTLPDGPGLDDPGLDDPGGPGRADPASGRVLLRVDQPDGFTNHKGGWLGFGPDGHLYAALGDGGGAGDPFGNAQDPDVLLGKVLRLGTDGTAPPDNPFAAGGGAAEVWALGLRNPWRAGFDRGLGDLWIGDVGQGRWEEVDRGAPGANYGWDLFEGPDPYPPDTGSGGSSPTGGPAAGTPTPPVFSYGREDGRSITGGTVYRGGAEALHGDYVFADFASGRLWSLRPGAGGVAATELTGLVETDAGSIDSPVSFGEDARGDLLLVDLDGEVFRLEPRGAAPDLGDDLRGEGGDDLLFGGPGDDAVSGGEGADELHGQSGEDRLDGGPGDDLLRGGPGADVFALAPGGGRDVVTDFGAGDRVEVLGGGAPTVAEEGGAAVLILPDGAALALPGVAPGALGPDLFL